MNIHLYFILIVINNIAKVGEFSQKELHIYGKILHRSQVFQVIFALLPELLVKRRRKAGDFFELIG
jgi:hypothetical protein